MKTGRNSMCPCDSGRKFKRCCGSESDKARKRAEDHAAFIANMKAKEEKRAEDARARGIIRHRPEFAFALCAMAMAIPIGRTR